MKLHIEGMGILGSLLATKLEQLGIKFTWNDTQQAVNAWRASTGCIYPSGDPFDIENYQEWAANYFNLSSNTSRATYCFLSKNPPHGGKYQFERHGQFGVAALPSYHLNAQRFVPRTRKYFSDLEQTAAPRGSQIIVAHGFNERLVRYLWGWTVKVRLQPFSLPLCKGTITHCLYMRVGRFGLAYAYPIPGENGWHYAGSHLISQKKAKPLTIGQKFESWQKQVSEYANIHVAEIGTTLEGWRPAPAETDMTLVRELNGRWVMKPLWHSGIRHAPAMVKAILEKL